MTNLVLFPGYKDLYDGEVPELQEIIAGIPTCIIVGFASHINSWKHHNQFDFNIDLDIFRYVIGRLPIETRTILESRLKNIYSDITKNKHAVTIFPLPQMLQLIEYAIVNYQEGPFENILPEQEENLLKAVLILNTMADIKSETVDLNKRSNDPFENFVKITWPYMLPTIEHTYKKEIIIPVYSAFLLFEYLNKDDFFRPYLTKYFANNGLKDGAEYLKNIMSLYVFSFNKDSQRFDSNFKDEDIKKVPLFKQFTRVIDSATSVIFSTQEKKFFKLLREKPILKINGGKDFIANWSYIIDKMYDGIKYDFFEHSGIKDAFTGDEKNKWNSFTSKLGERFSEKVIFKDLVNRYFSRNNAVIKFDGDSKNWNQDLYHRKDNHITFIEYKGITFPLNDKYDRIKSDIDTRMVVSVNDKNEVQKKAVHQLVTQISNFHENINKFENIQVIGYTRERLLIYPVIIFTDLNWRLAGVNEYLLRIFEVEIKKLNLNFFQVKELVMIHIDFFYNHENIFLRDNINLHQFIYQGIQSKETYRAIRNRMLAPSTEAIMDSYADFEFYAHTAFKNSFVHSHDMSLFNEVVEKLNLPS
ncbi:MAG TPA: hypothetical protein VK783_10925 [Bacteroidia bacterium]|jgi:hypothetical protein|nr:hypothetical protein [Bacteroidia bacterium]